MREIRPYGSVRGVRRKPYPYRDTLNPMPQAALFLGRPSRHVSQTDIPDALRKLEAS